MTQRGHRDEWLSQGIGALVRSVVVAGLDDEFVCVDGVDEAVFAAGPRSP